MSLSPALLFAASIGPLKRLQRDRDFDLIDAHYFYPDGAAAVLLGQYFRKPVVITARGTDVNLIPKYRLPRAMITAAARRAAGIVAVSQALKACRPSTCRYCATAWISRCFTPTAAMRRVRRSA
jgi:hypothetical protein